MQCTDHRRRVKQTIHKWQAVHIRCNIDISVRLAKPLLSLFQLRTRVIEQDNPLKAEVARRISSGTGSQFQQETSALRQELLEGNGFRAVFVFASALIPKGSLVIRVFVITNRRGSFVYP